jgi:hypothetical protein
MSPVLKCLKLKKLMQLLSDEKKIVAEVNINLESAEFGLLSIWNSSFKVLGISVSNKLSYQYVRAWSDYTDGHAGLGLYW